jgi:hypothetical protein
MICETLAEMYANFLTCNFAYKRADKMCIKQLTLATLLISTSMHSLAVEWTSIITKPDYEILVDIDSYNTADGYPYILTKTVFNTAQALKDASNSATYTYHIKNTQFNCSEPQYKVTSTRFFNGQAVAVATAAAQTQFAVVAQDSDEFSVGQLVCQVHRMVGGQ